MRKFSVKPICEKCAHDFELSIWGPKERDGGTPFAHYHVEFVAEDPKVVAENGDVENEGKSEHLLVACPVCGHSFEMQTAADYLSSQVNIADLYVPPEPPKDA